jgi:hypothetical protein
MLVENHVAEFFKVKPIKIVSSLEIRRLMDTIVINISALKALGQPVEHWDLIVVQVVKMALDK